MANVRITDLNTIPTPIDTSTEYLMTDNSSNTHKISIATLLSLAGLGGVAYVLTCPTSGYTTQTVTIWGESKTVEAITLTADYNSDPLTNFTEGMYSEYPINIDADLDDFKKLYAFSIGNQSVTFYFTEAPSTAFNVLIKEAI